MNLIMLSVVSLLLTCSFRFWRLVVDRNLSFRLHEIRDELRWLAISRPELRSRPAFQHFDVTIARVNERLETYSFWTTLLRYKKGDDPGFDAWFAAFQQDVESEPEIKALFIRFGEVLIERTRARHFALLAVLGVLVKLFHRKPLEERVVKPAFAAVHC
jgi:hypothetical protein